MLRLEGVVKRRRRVVLDGVTLEVAAGEVVALAGANGSGKTSLLRLAAGLDRPSSGRVLVGGRDAGADGEAARALVGWCGDRPALFAELTVEENLEAWARLLRVGARDAPRDVLERFGLAPAAQRRAGELSRGLAQRVALARAFLGDPPLLLLDEPATALDADGRARLEGLLAARRAPDRATLVATHEEAPAWATRTLRLARGRLVDGGAA